MLALKISAKRLPRSWVDAVRHGLQEILGFSKFNATYQKVSPCNAADFSRHFLGTMHVGVEFDGVPIDRIPVSGPLIVIANHPFGLIEGMALEALVLARRPDVTVMATYLLAAIPEYADRLIFVDPRVRRSKRRLNVQAWRRSVLWLKNGGALLVFPAGRVATFHWGRMTVADQPWSSHIAAVARQARARILPVYFHGHNGWAFQLVNALCPPLQDLLLLREVVNKDGQTLRATVGRLIEPVELSQLETDNDATAFLRQETERLARL